MTQQRKRLYLVLAVYLTLSLIGLIVFLTVSHQNKLKNTYNDEINAWLSDHITNQTSYRLDAVVFTTFAYGTASGQKPQNLPDVSDYYELTVFKDTQTAKIEYQKQELYYGSNNSSNSSTDINTSSYLSVNGSTVTIWLYDRSGGYQKRIIENSKLANAISSILFTDSTDICDGTVLSAQLTENTLSADKETLTLKRSIAAQDWYLPYEILSGKTSAVYSPISLEFTYATDTDGMRKCIASDITDLYAFAYAAMHGSEYSNIYTQNNLSYIQTLTVDFSDTGLAKSFSLPD